MVVKVEAAIGAINRGVGRVVFADARVEQAVTKALAGEGTVVRAARDAMSRFNTASS
jgi:acetylglutamate/LysW-gamma-L-alpha-aminoadipate kinase